MNGNLYEAILANNEELCQSLINRGVDINGMNENGDVAIKIAIEQKSLVICQQLIKANADIFNFPKSSISSILRYFFSFSPN